MSESPYLSEEDIRAIVRLLGEAMAGEGDISIKRRRVMDGVRRLIGANSWIWTMVGRFGPDEQPAHTVLVRDGFTEEQFAAYIRSQEHPDMRWLVGPFIAEVEETGDHLTRLRQQMTSNEEFDAADIKPLFEKAGFGPLILSARKTLSGQLSAVVIFRHFDAPLFTERESRMAHIILSELAWLHEISWPNYPRHEVSTLSPRERSVLTSLLQGRSRKEIADDFGISIHTVSGYVKEVYRHFNVNSHAELFHRFVNGDGGDLPR